MLPGAGKFNLKFTPNPNWVAKVTHVQDTRTRKRSGIRRNNDSDICETWNRKEQTDGKPSATKRKKRSVR